MPMSSLPAAENGAPTGDWPESSGLFAFSAEAEPAEDVAGGPALYFPVAVFGERFDVAGLTSWFFLVVQLGQM